jgi:hypothetical protein
VDDLYAVSVPVAGASSEATRAATAEALERVLVKVTGRESTREDTSLLGRLGDPGAMVQRFRLDGAGSLWVQFDAAAVRRALTAAGLPVWGEDRPATLVWLAYDTGGGEREVLASGEMNGPAGASLKRDLLAAATARGVPLVLPLRDSEDLAAVTFSDLWGDFTEPVIRASARYQPDAVLIGRARLFPASASDVRWTLMLHEQRLDWRGDIAAGPAGLAEHMAQRLASSAGADAQTVTFRVAGIRTFDDYGLLLGYLQGLDVVESLQVQAVAADTMTFNLGLRGDAEQLTRSLAVGRVVVPAEEIVSSPAGALPAELTYRLNPAP